VILSFLLTTGPIAKAQEFVSFNATQRAKIISDYHARGISIIVAAFGDSESPTGAGKDPVQVAKTMADFVKRYNVSEFAQPSDRNLPVGRFSWMASTSITKTLTR
jgi:hypothetical protein